MFDADGEFIYEHDLENGLWDGHSYDCSSPSYPCDCEGPGLAFSWIDEDDEFHEGFYADDEDDIEAWVDYATYVDGR